MRCSSRRMRMWPTLLAIWVIFAVLSLAADARCDDTDRGDLQMPFDATKQLCREAATIVVGHITSARSYWSADSSTIYTEYSVDPLREVKGHVPAAFSIVVEGGEVGGITLQVLDGNTIAVGNDYALFIAGPAPTPRGSTDLHLSRRVDLGTEVDREFIDRVQAAASEQPKEN